MKWVASNFSLPTFSRFKKERAVFQLIALFLCFSISASSITRHDTGQLKNAQKCNVLCVPRFLEPVHPADKVKGETGNPMNEGVGVSEPGAEKSESRRQGQDKGLFFSFYWSMNLSIWWCLQEWKKESWTNRNIDTHDQYSQLGATILLFHIFGIAAGAGSAACNWYMKVRRMEW